MPDVLVAGRFDWLLFLAFGLGTYYVAWADSRSPRWLRSAVGGLMSTIVVAVLAVMATAFIGKPQLLAIAGVGSEAMSAALRIAAVAIASLSLAGIGELALRLATGDVAIADAERSRQGVLMVVTLAASVGTSQLLAFGRMLPIGLAIAAFLVAVIATEIIAARSRAAEA